MATVAAANPAAPSSLAPSVRWVLFGILCLAGISNAMDRQIIALLKSEMSAELGWTDETYGRLAAYFQFAAAAAFLVTGWLVDKLGVKWGNVVGVAAWSIAAAAHGWATAGWHFVACRIGLGATEAMGTPLTIKTVAAVFPPDQRSLAIGLQTLIAAVGLVSMPFLIPWFASLMGWRGAFIIAGAAGIVIVGLWLLATRGIRFDDGAEDARIDFADDEQPYGPILTERRTWAIAIAKALSDATWWLFLYWLPDFYRRQYGLSGTGLAGAMAVAYFGSGGGAFFWGWLSTRLLERGWSVDLVRKRVMLVSALIVTPVPLVLGIDNLVLVALVMAIVLAGHQGFSLSLFSVITDVVPRAKVGRVTSFGAFAGNLGGAAIAWIAGVVLTAGLGYLPLFLFAAVSYLLAYACIRLLLPEIRRAERAEAGAALPTH
ncbi:MFS transporter [Sphingomonas sp. BN140010]|uniref:MFS transporter n=1 Tax=Sphingomonas arvum TaxID=2992113 RepID=A0ABT3JF70_9SPHN|nr:MFS transporter [Sphingomonas sp. BN140010]MCW3797584.1 MFS transporter [Sphingomonas sp. BN140010]